jgi:hypothetical protein
MSCGVAASARKEEGFCPMTGHCPGGACPMKKPSCPNSDPGFNKIIGEDRTPEERSKLFIVCVIVRTLLYSGVYVYRDKPWMPWLVGIISLFSVFQLYTSDSPNGRQWWSKKFQLVMALLVLISAALVKFNGLDSRAMAGLLFVSLIGGILQRSQVKFC